MHKVNIIIIAMIILSGCHRNAVITVTPADATIFEISEPVINSHLSGWRRAEILYEKEFNIKPTKEIAEKLEKIRFLILIRQIEEDIPDPNADEMIRTLCAEDVYDKRLCEIVKWVQNGKKNEELIAELFIPVKNDPVFENYLTLFLFQTIPSFDAFSVLESFKPIKQSPLFLYMNPRIIASMDPAEFEKTYPYFAEGFVLLADQMFETRKYRLSREFYQKTLKLIPNYTKALSGIGDIYYMLEDYERALHNYNMVLRYAPSDIAAMYRKGLSLQQLKRYEESNDTIDKMLLLDTIQSNLVNGIFTAQYYKGQGNYIKAYNYYLLNNNIKSREFVDLAKKTIPSSFEFNYLSGVLFYESNELESARQDFMRSLDGSNCHAPLHLGFVYEKLDATNENIVNDKEAFMHRSVPSFLEAAECFDKSVQSLNRAINEFAFSEFEPAEQERLKNEMTKKLTSLRTFSTQIIKNINDRIDEYVSATEKYIISEYLVEILSRLEKQ